jgi:protoporphyrinogen oxidase
MRVVVVGGGIAGLAAALRLREGLGPKAAITVVDQAARPGGKLRTEPFSGEYAEAGAEAFVTTDPAAVLLAERVGLGDALRHPATGQAALAIAGELVPIPKGTLMGVPADPADVASVAAVDAAADHDGGRPLLGPGEDVPVGALVRARLGAAVLDRLVDPLLGGVYAGRGDDLSLAATVPALAAACRTESTLTGAVRVALRRRPAAAGAVFATIDGGMSRLVDAVVAASGAELRLGAPVRALERAGTRWRIVVGSAAGSAGGGGSAAGSAGGGGSAAGGGAALPRAGSAVLDADAIVLAVPARPAARLLAGVSPAAAAEVGVLDYASVALVTLAVRGARLPELSGFLVPASEGYAVKALTIFTTKWGHLARSDGLAVVRASVGRYGETAVLRRTDEDLAALVHAELDRLVGPLPEPEAVRVTRWGGGLPQYGPGHLDRVARARAALADVPGLALAGAAYDGVGIPACVRSGWAAAERLLVSVGW